MPRRPFSDRRCVRTGEIPALVKLWLLRLLVPLGCQREFIGESGFDNDSLAEVVGLKEWIDSCAYEFDRKSVRAALRQRHLEAEHKLRKARPPKELSGNIKRLARLVGLSATDCRVLEFAVLIHSERLLDDTADWLGNLSAVKVCRVLSVLLGIPEDDIRASLCAQGVLARSGLVSMNRDGQGTLRVKLALLSDRFGDLMLSPETDPVALLRDTVSPGSPPELEIGCYPHLSRSLDLLRPYLRHARKTRRRGVNIFLHGESGTGKTQLARVLAKELGCELFEIASEDEDGDPVRGEQRLRAFRAAQSFFAVRQALILFDEVEDVFADGDWFMGRKSTARRARPGATAPWRKTRCRPCGSPIQSAVSTRPSSAVSTWSSKSPFRPRNSASVSCVRPVAICCQSAR